MEYKTVNNLKIPQNLSPEKQAVVDEIARNYANQIKSYDNQLHKDYGRMAGGTALSIASFLPIFNVPVVGTGLGGAMYDLGQGIVEGDNAKDLAKRTARGFAIGETVGAVPYVGKLAGKTKAGQAVLNSAPVKAAEQFLDDAVEKFAQSKAYDALMTDIKAFNPNKQTVYHGSPYDFEKFSNEAIGTGEGAQAHGLGHYAALDKDTAEAYAKNLSEGNKVIEYNGKIYKSNAEFKPNEYNYKMLSDVKTDGIEAAKNFYKDQEQWAREKLAKSNDKEWWKDTVKAAEGTNKLLDTINPNLISDIRPDTGQLYKLSVPKDDVMLREDLPFSEQPKAVQEALKKLANDYKEIGYGDLLDSIGYDEKGDSFYRLYSRLAGNGGNAARELSDRGIKGISYNGGIDGEARVIFNPDDIDIVRKYYNVPTINDLLNKINAGSSSDSIYQYLNNPKANKNFEKELQNLINPPANIDENTIRAIIGGVSDDAYNLGLKNGYDLTNFNHVIDKSAYNHFLKHFGNNEIAEDLSPLTIDDLRGIPNIIYSPDSLEFIQGTNRKLPRIKYTKKTDNGNQTYLEQIQNKTKRLNTKTYWKEK